MATQLVRGARPLVSTDAIMHNLAICEKDSRDTMRSPRNNEHDSEELASGHHLLVPWQSAIKSPPDPRGLSHLPLYTALPHQLQAEAQMYGSTPGK